MTLAICLDCRKSEGPQATRPGNMKVWPTGNRIGAKILLRNHYHVMHQCALKSKGYVYIRNIFLTDEVLAETKDKNEDSEDNELEDETDNLTADKLKVLNAKAKKTVEKHFNVFFAKTVLRQFSQKYQLVLKLI